MASLTKLQSAKQYTMQQLAVVEDRSKIIFATVNRSATKELDIAIVKSTTSQFHVVPKEKHVRTLKNSAHPAKPRREVQYMILELLRRLYTASDWVTALKTLIVVHRLMRETDVTFIEEMLKVSEDTLSESRPGHSSKSDEAGQAKARGQVLRVDDFLDTTTIDGRFDYSEWVRAYGKYLDEQLDVYNQINFYLEQEDTTGESRMRALQAKDLLFQLPRLQKLLQKLLDCIPKGAALKDEIVQLSLLLAVKESFKLYKAISEGIINLADSFFEMEYLDAQKGLDIYKHFISETESLQTYYQHVEGIDNVKASVQFPPNFKLETPPPDFLQQMENYVKEAPKGVQEAGAPSKVSPPLRRGTKNKTFRAGGLTSSVSSIRSDPGMVMPVGSETLPEAEVVQKEVDLLALDMEEVVTVSEQPQNNGPAAGNSSGLAELFSAPASSGDPFAAPPPQFPQAQQPPSAFQQAGADIFGRSTSFTSNPNTSFTSNPSQSFSGNANPFGPSGPSQSNGMRPPPLMSTFISGSGDSGQFSPQVSQFSPSPQVSGFGPQSSQFSPAVSNSLGGMGAPMGGGMAPTPRSAQPQVPASPSGSFTSFGVPPSNLRQSALHDPFAEFNAVKKPEPKEVKDTSPPMRPMNNSFGNSGNSFTSATFSPTASPVPSFSSASQGIGVASRGPSQVSPTPSFASAPAQQYGNSFANSFSSQQNSFSGQHTSFTAQPQAAAVATAAAFPTTFDDNKSNSLI